MQSSSQKNFFQASSSYRFNQTQKSSTSVVRQSVIRKHPLLDIKLGDEFHRLKGFKLQLEGDFCSISVQEDCLLELQKITLPWKESFSATLSILVPVQTETTAEGSNPTGKEYQIYGLKQIELPFSKEPVRVRVAGGQRMDESYYLTFRLYC